MLASITFSISKAVFSRAFADPLTERSASTVEKSGPSKHLSYSPHFHQKSEEGFQPRPLTQHAPPFQHIHH